MTAMIIILTYFCFRDMFKVPNKAGFEMVAHFLFDTLNPARAKEEFT